MIKECMFVEVSVGRPTPNASSSPPSLSDCLQILSNLNNGSFIIRSPPSGEVSANITQIWGELSHETFSLSCHAVARHVAHQFANQGLQRVSGYLIRNSIDITFLHQANSLNSSPHFTIDSQTNRVTTWLHHHSVALDSQGNYIECLPPEWYPTDEFVFVPHPSGEQGYFLLAV